MSNQRTQQVLYESEAALRLVDHGLQELCGNPSAEAEGHPDSGLPSAAERLAAMLASANDELDRACALLRETRDALALLPDALVNGASPALTSRLTEATSGLQASEARLQQLAEQVSDQQIAAADAAARFL